LDESLFVCSKPLHCLAESVSFSAEVTRCDLTGSIA
jgi:hypothetical protein